MPTVYPSAEFIKMCYIRGIYPKIILVLQISLLKYYHIYIYTLSRALKIIIITHLNTLSDIFTCIFTVLYILKKNIIAKSAGQCLKWKY